MHQYEDVAETEQSEASKTKSAPMATAVKVGNDRYRAEIRQRGRWTYEVDLVTTHTIQSVPGLDPLFPESRLLAPIVVLGARWARWKARRMVAAAHRRDVREAQPWVTYRGER